MFVECVFSLERRKNFLPWSMSIQPVRLAGGWWLVLICSERNVLRLVVSGWFVMRKSINFSFFTMPWAKE
jgi:hypothetical protein